MLRGKPPEPLEIKGPGVGAVKACIKFLEYADNLREVSDVVFEPLKNELSY
jgi:hypothetical protein